MQIFLFFELAWLTVASVTSGPVFHRLFGDLLASPQHYSVNFNPCLYPVPSIDYESYNAGGYQHQRSVQQSHSEHGRSYKDICRIVNTNAFTNPGNVPKCPY
ncbi:uncharacterized protein LOC118738160 [Rhagoletis pomonella]|uniref:uncharacterized protein LOC118738160 n=1 Tax=Rhagoletis pomonella TaxID=28610 RepID=UPI001780C305|nr:uncharacterized protein LOC118738160 [Rhagoletis pomonella]